MSRSTQFVGLTDAATMFVRHFETAGEHIGAEGIAGEPIHMGKWTDPEGHGYVEVAQIVPWSSGPCIFTCLEWHPRGEDPDKGLSGSEALHKLRDALGATLSSGADAQQVVEMLSFLDAAEVPNRTLLFEWTIDPTLRACGQEWDNSKGTYWI